MRTLTNHLRPRRLAAGVAVLLAGLAAALVAPAPAAAALGDFPLVTYNMQGATSGNDSKWTTTISGYAAGAEIVALQEAGPTPPPPAEGTQVELIQLNVPGLPAAGNAQVVQHSLWQSGLARYDVYFLQTDANGGTFVGGRTNMAILTQRAADEVTAVANPAGRAALGVRFGATWYFTLHARVGGNDANPMLTEIANTVAARGLNENWVVLGDFNRTPGNLAIPAGARTYSSGLPTQQGGNELDYLVASENANGIQVNRLAGASADHYAVALGALRAAAEPTVRHHSDRAVESVRAGGVLDASHEGTGNGTEIISWHRTGGANQTWTLDFYRDNTVRFRGRASNRCVDVHNSTSAQAGRPLVLWDCTDQASQRWVAEAAGDSEVRLHNALRPDLCMDVAGAPSTPDAGNVIVWPCSDDANQRWLFTPADATTDVDRTPITMSAYHTQPATVESLRAGGVLDAFHERTGNGTAIVSWHRTGQANQGWNLDWFAGDEVRFRGLGSDRCIDIRNSHTAGPGRGLVLFDCTDQASQRWRTQQLDNDQVLLRNVSRPDLCMDISGGPTVPDRGGLIVWPCSAAANQQWIFTIHDPDTGPEYDHPHDEL